MWIVKRMSTARILVLTLALGAGGVAAHIENGSQNKPPPIESVAQFQSVDVPVAPQALAHQTAALSLSSMPSGGHAI
jgi:pilus assembly protein CpaB